MTKIFEGIDAEFKAMMQESCTEFNVIAVQRRWERTGADGDEEGFG